MKLLMIYNPYAGHATQQNMARVSQAIRDQGFELAQLSMLDDDFSDQFLRLLDNLDGVISFGGDGTLNFLVNYIVTKDIDPPPLIPYPSGTANDFAHHIFGDSHDVTAILTAVDRGSYQYIDVGQVNERYFINVLGAGLFTDIAVVTKKELKQKYGMWAYWLEALKNLSRYHPNAFFISDGHIQETIEAYLLLILNGRGAGGFKSLAPMSSLTDGKLDIIAVTEVESLLGLATLFPKILMGEHLSDHRIKFLQKDRLDIDSSAGVKSVIDGEQGPDFPLTVQVLPRRLPCFYLDPKT